MSEDEWAVGGSHVVDKTVSGIETMLRRLLGEDIDITVHLADDLGAVVADPGQIEQVIMNLAVNARDAMPQGGRLSIETRNAELGQGYADEHISMGPGRFVLLSVSDTGSGMDAAFHCLWNSALVAARAGTGSGSIHSIEASRPHTWMKLFLLWTKNQCRKQPSGVLGNLALASSLAAPLPALSLSPVLGQGS